MKMIIAEKPSVAKLFTSALKDNFRNRPGYSLGDNYIVTWAYGHLVNSKGPSDYESFGGWNWDSIPFFPPNGSLDYKTPNETDFDKRRAEQIKNIKKAYTEHGVTEVYNACDAGREGDLIFWELYHHVNMISEVKRIWLNSMEEEDALESITDAKGKDFFEPKKNAAYARQYADWVLGNNLTIAFTTKVNSTLHVGRVQTPTLNLLAQRRLTIDNFVPKDYFELEANFGNKYKGKWFRDDLSNTRIDSEEEAARLKTELTSKPGKITKKEVKKQAENPLRLHDLGELQKEANKKFGFTGAKTLAVAQELYDKYKVISYPRTDSRYLAESQVDGLKRVLESIVAVEYKDFSREIIDSGIPINKNFVDGSKVTDHYAIIPTRKSLNINEFSADRNKGIEVKDLVNLYDLIVKRFLSVFFPAAEYERTEIITEVSGETFKTNGRILIDEGWKKVYAKSSNEIEDEDDESEESEEGEISPVELGDVNEVSSIKNEAKKTKPPQHYNDSTIISAMERAKEFLEGDEREELEDSKTEIELGTVATRSNILENIISRGYAERKGRRIIATDLGLKLVEIAPENLKSPEVTATWEMKLKQMESNNYDLEVFKEEIREFVSEEIAGLQTKEISVEFEDRNQRNVVGICKSCKGDITEYNSVIACSTSTMESSCFKIWKVVARKKLTKKAIKDLIDKGETAEIKGFKTKEGRQFSARLKYNFEEGKVEFKFPEAKVVAECPKCNTEVKARGNFYSCQSHTKENQCTQGFVSVYGRKLKDSEIKDLVEKGETDYLKLKSRETKRSYEAKIIMKNGKAELKFKPREVIKTELSCPECSTDIKKTGKVYKCETSDCKFVVFSTMSGKEITEEIIKEVFETGESGPYDDFKSKPSKGKPSKNFKAKLVYNKDRKMLSFKF